jgi:hypothetical protein
MPLPMPSGSTVVPGRVQPCPIGVRNVPEAADFVYVMRRDSEYVARQFVARLGDEAPYADILAAYDRAVDALAEAILRAFSAVHDAPAVDLIDSAAVHRRRLELIDGLDGCVISMDPLMEEGALPLAFSRCYRPGGVDFIEMIPRPGSPTLPEQVERIAAEAAGRPLIVVEDDFYTGDTLVTTLGKHLGESLAERIAGVVAGTKVGLREPSFPVYAAVRYQREGGLDPLEKVDLGDPRDYVIGASGLVCRVASGRLGRLPYVLPFVSPAARANIPAVAEASFSAEALELSRAFYADLSAIVGAPVTLELADPAFAIACEELLGISPGASMADVLSEVERAGPSLAASSPDAGP